MAPPEAPRWLDGAEEDLWRRLLAVQRRLLGRLDDDLRDAHDLTLADYDVLVVLSEAPGGALRMGDLAEQVALSPSGLTRRVDRLVARGLVCRRSCPSDGRGSLAAPTAEGRRVLAQAAPTHVAGVRRYLLSPLDGRDLPALLETLGRISTVLADGRGRSAEGCCGQPGAGGDQAGPGPSTTGRPEAAHPLVPPATDTAR